MTVSFSESIKPLFYQYRSHMRWRLDLTNYNDVKNNAKLIADNIKPGGGMPPGPFPPLTSDQVALFTSWVEGGCQP